MNLLNCKWWKPVVRQKPALDCLVLVQHSLIMLIFLLVLQLRAEDGYIVNHYITAEFYGEMLYAYDVKPQSIYTTSDDGVVVIAIASFELDDINSIDVGAVTRLDANGDMVWQKTIRPATGMWGFDWATGIGIDENDTVSFILANNDYSRERLFIELDYNGNVSSHPLELNQALYTTEFHFNKALRIDSGEIIAVGKIKLAPLYRWNVAYYRFSDNGAILASAFIPPDSTGFEFADARDVVIDENGNVLISGIVNAFQNELFRLDMNGNNLQRIPVQVNVDNLGASRPLYLSHSEGSTFCTIAFRDAPLAVDHLSLIIARLSGMNISYCEISDSSTLVPFSMQGIGNDVYVVAYDFSSGFELIRLNYIENYEIAWAWSNPQMHFYMPSGGVTHMLSRSHNNCIFIVGEYANMIYVAKVLPNGQLPVDDEIEALPAKRMSAYPNPMQGELRISVEGKGAEDVSNLKLFNIRGQLVKTLMIDRSCSVVWDGTDSTGKECPAGLYLIYDAQGFNHAMKIIKL